MEVLHIVSGPDSMAHNSHVDSYRYPKAGTGLSFCFRLSCKTRLLLSFFSECLIIVMCSGLRKHI